MIKVLKLYTPRREVVARPKEHRGSRHDRGYDSVWERTSRSHLKRFPICVECERNGLTVLADVVDHKIPIEFRPDLRLDPKNRWSLCHHCHNGIKRRMEAYAIKAKMIDLLISWCDDPATRPAALTTTRTRRRKKEMLI